MRDRYGADVVLLLDSGTSALRMAIELAMSARPNLPVALPAYCCYDMASAAVGAGASVLLYDIDPVTLGPDFDSLERVLRAGVGVAVVAHLFGYPVDFATASSLCKEAGCLLIEDAAQGAGGTADGKPLGGLGALSTLSFGRGKGTTTGGGGALLVRGEHEVEVPEEWMAARRPRPRGVGSAARLTGQYVLSSRLAYGVLSAMPFLGVGKTVYRPPSRPHLLSHAGSAVIPEAVGADETRLRQQRAERLRAYLRARRVPTIDPIPGGTPGDLRFPFVRGGAHAHERLARRARCVGILSSYPKTLADLPAIQGRLQGESAVVPGARLLAERLMTAPTHGGVRDHDLESVGCMVCRLAGSAAA